MRNIEFQMTKVSRIEYYKTHSAAPYTLNTPTALSLSWMKSLASDW